MGSCEEAIQKPLQMSIFILFRSLECLITRNNNTSWRALQTGSSERADEERIVLAVGFHTPSVTNAVSQWKGWRRNARGWEHLLINCPGSSQLMGFCTEGCCPPKLAEKRDAWAAEGGSGSPRACRLVLVFLLMADGFVWTQDPHFASLF